MKKIDINKESLRGYKLLGRIESMAKIARIATSDTNSTLEIEDFKGIFEAIEELAKKTTTVVSNLEMATD